MVKNCSMKMETNHYQLIREMNSFNNHPFNNKKNTQENGTNETQNNPLIDQQREQLNITDFFSDNQMNENVQSNSSVVQSDHVLTNQASKPIEKQENQYIKFYKYYYQKLKTQHPNWSTLQITTIVSLQWKKKKMITKKPIINQQRTQATRRRKPISARQAFYAAHPQMNKVEREAKWNGLPKQSKNYWKKQGQAHGNTQQSQINSTNVRSQNIISNPMKNLLNRN